jgi:lysophospholipase L1-like esterase
MRVPLQVFFSAAALLLSACGSSGGSSTSDSGADSGMNPPPLNPNPIISRHKTTFSSPSGGAAVVNGSYHDGGWRAGTGLATTPAWVAIQLDPGPTRVLVSWDDGGTYNYQDPAGTTVYGLPDSYQIATSADSTNGMDGTWNTQVMVTGNVVRTRAHAVDFTGQSWVRMTISAEAPTDSDGVHIGEIDVHDISATGTGIPDDSWFFMGDSITAFAYDRAILDQPSFAALINMDSPTFFPAMINGGIGGEKSSDGLARLQQALTLNPDYKYFALSYGTNDAAGGQVSTTAFGNNMQMMIDTLKAAGRIPVIPRIPYSGDGNHGSVPNYNAVIDQLTQTNGLMTGPDLYAYFMAHTDEFMADNLHPNNAGFRAMNQLWADAMRSLYP